MGKRLLEIIEMIKKDSNYEAIREVVRTDLKKFMIGDSYNDEYYLQITKISAGWAYSHLEVFLRTGDITQEQIFNVLMSFDVTILHNAQLLMDYIYTYEVRDSTNYLLVLDTQKLFNKLRTEMPIEYREDYPIAKRVELLQEKGLNFKW
jgi:hypothetical protein